MNIRRHALASAVASGILLGSSTPGFCDLSPSDLGEAADHITDSILEGISNLADLICQVLLAPFEDWVPSVLAPIDPPQEHVAGAPTTVEQAAELSDEIAKDRAARVEALDTAASQASQKSKSAAMTVEGYQAANKAAAVSVTSQIAIGNEIMAEGAKNEVAQTELLAGMAAMQAEQAHQEGEALVRRKAWVDAHYANGMWQGQRTWEPDTIKMPW